MPIIYPGDVQEAIDLGRHAIAMSRSCGVWVSIKVVEAVADGTGSVEVHHERIEPVAPTMEVNGRLFVPTPSGNLITPYTLDMEREFHDVRLALAREYAVLNHLNTIPVRGPADWVGIVATGQTYNQMVEALRLLGLRTDDQLRASGIRLFKLAMPVPLDMAQVREFADGLAEVIVIEEKAQNLEWLVKDALFGRADRPVVVGKRTPTTNRSSRSPEPSMPTPSLPACDLGWRRGWVTGWRRPRPNCGSSSRCPSLAHRSSVPGVRTTRRRRCPTARSWAPASDATRWCC